MKSVVRADTFYCCYYTNKTSPSRLPGEDGAARRLALKLQEKPQETQREATRPRGNQLPQAKALPGLGATCSATAPSRGQALGQGCPRQDKPSDGPCVPWGVRLGTARCQEQKTRSHQHRVGSGRRLAVQGVSPVGSGGAEEP